MNARDLFKSFLTRTIVTLLVICSAQFAWAAWSPSFRSYAVFIATYDEKTGRAFGGVAGTAFFTAERKAITAYHVLQPGSWTAPEGERRQIWLVHEGEPAIELRPENLSYQPDRDLTRVELGPEQAVSPRYVFAVEPDAQLEGVAVMSEGFRAGTVGPSLEFENGRLRITAVPLLERLNVKGEFMRAARVELRAKDVRLDSVPCLQLSYRPVIGLSGGPVVSAAGKVIGVNSFADPRTREQTWAVRFSESYQ